MQISRVLDSGYVQRYHTNPELARIGQQNSAHQWGASMILLHIYPEASKELLTYVLTHDVGELGTVDLPGPFKQLLKKIAPTAERALTHIEAANRQSLLETDFIAFTAVELVLIRLVDQLEALDFAVRFDPAQVNSVRWFDLMKSVRKGCATLEEYGVSKVATRALVFYNNLERISVAGKG